MGAIFSGRAVQSAHFRSLHARREKTRPFRMIRVCPGGREVGSRADFFSFGGVTASALQIELSDSVRVRGVRESIRAVGSAEQHSISQMRRLVHRMLECDLRDVVGIDDEGCHAA